MSAEQEHIELTFHGLTELDKLELEQQLKGGTVTFGSPIVDPGDLGEMDVWTAVVTIAIAAIPTAGVTLGYWLSKGKRYQVLRYKAIVVNGDGSRMEGQLYIKSSSSDAISAEVVEQVTKLANTKTSPPNDPSLTDANDNTDANTDPTTDA